MGLYASRLVAPVRPPPPLSCPITAGLPGPLLVLMFIATKEPRTCTSPLPFSPSLHPSSIGTLTPVEFRQSRPEESVIINHLSLSRTCSFKRATVGSAGQDRWPTTSHSPLLLLRPSTTHTHTHRRTHDTHVCVMWIQRTDIAHAQKGKAEKCAKVRQGIFRLVGRLKQRIRDSLLFLLPLPLPLPLPLRPLLLLSGFSFSLSFSLLPYPDPLPPQQALSPLSFSFVAASHLFLLFSFFFLSPLLRRRTWKRSSANNTPSGPHSFL